MPSLRVLLSFSPIERSAFVCVRRLLQPGEPLNLIISGSSHPSVLRDDGLIRYAKKLGFAPECLNIHLGEPQSANLNDGNGWSEQLLEIRQAYFPVFGSCLASAVGKFATNYSKSYLEKGKEEK